MIRKIAVGIGTVVFIAIIGYFLGVAVVIVALAFFGIGYLVARRHKGNQKSKDIVFRIRR